MDRLQADEAAVPPYPVQNAFTGALRKASNEAGRADYLSLWAGQGVEAVRPMSASALMALLEEEWKQASARVGAAR
ncbi:hypothetical protein D3C71_1905000 [compost metagenome]